MTEPKGPSIDPRELDRIERLRDRTDEIELIISGLTTVALFTLPGWLFETVSASFSHRSLLASQGVEMVLVIVPGLFYALGCCFAVHLMIRAYWAGLVGLRSVFPGGIAWDRVPGMGRQTRQHYREHLPDLSRAISSADHVASGLFSVISMIALGMLWATGYLGLMLLMGLLFGQVIGDPDLALKVALWVLMGVLMGLPSLLWLLDSVIGSRAPQLAARAGYRSTVRALIRLNGWIWPQRLILPVQLTLQSNTRPYLFSLLFALGTASIVILGFVRYTVWTEFSLSGEFRYLDRAALAEGIDSAHYEDLRAVRDRLRPVPTIDAFEQRGAFVRVFLPYYPQRDNPVLDADCDRKPLDCLRGLWSLRLDSRGLAAGSLLPTERRDLNQRGLTAAVPAFGLAPGVHVLEIDWNGGDEQEAGRTYTIPFLFSPDQELSAESPVRPGRVTAPF